MTTSPTVDALITTGGLTAEEERTLRRTGTFGIYRTDPSPGPFTVRFMAPDGQEWEAECDNLQGARLVADIARRLFQGIIDGDGQTGEASATVVGPGGTVVEVDVLDVEPRGKGEDKR